jgi:hypothetical protein
VRTQTSEQSIEKTSKTAIPRHQQQNEIWEEARALPLDWSALILQQDILVASMAMD